MVVSTRLLREGMAAYDQRVCQFMIREHVKT